jgi:glucose/arabinose dehydrogenase
VLTLIRKNGYHLAEKIRMRAIFNLLLLILGIGCFVIPDAFAAPQAPCEIRGPLPPIPSIELKSVIKGLRDPVGMFHAQDGGGRLFIIEQGGTIRILSEGRLLKEPFLNIRDRVISGGEMGLLGLAFHPDFSRNGRFFVNYTSRSGRLHTVISEFKISSRPNEADPESERILLTIDQPYSNHNGGAIAFGPDGALYIGTGDGGAGNDPHENGQNLAILLGKMLRIDVDKREADKPYGIPRDNPFISRRGAAKEVWAYGLRNPWRFSFDSLTGRLYAGDVGQKAREEIDVIEKGKNYGWNITEGTLCTPGVNIKCNKRGLEPPIIDYPRSEGTVVIGGYVYRGQSIPSLCGVYLFADFGNGRIFGLRYHEKKVTEHRVLLSTRRSISSLGEDEQLELYLLDYEGEVLKIIPVLRP